MTTKHTPGLWNLANYTELPSGARGVTVFSAGHAPQIAKIEFHGERETGLSEEENQANACLIATAPDLLAELRAIAQTSLEYHSDYAITETEAMFYKRQLQGVIESARNALKLAEGE